MKESDNITESQLRIQAIWTISTFTIGCLLLNISLGVYVIIHRRRFKANQSILIINLPASTFISCLSLTVTAVPLAIKEYHNEYIAPKHACAMGAYLQFYGYNSYVTSLLMMNIHVYRSLFKRVTMTSEVTIAMSVFAWVVNAIVCSIPLLTNVQLPSCSFLGHIYSETGPWKAVIIAYIISNGLQLLVACILSSLGVSRHCSAKHDQSKLPFQIFALCFCNLACWALFFLLSKCYYTIVNHFTAVIKSL